MVSKTLGRFVEWSVWAQMREVDGAYDDPEMANAFRCDIRTLSAAISGSSRAFLSSFRVELFKKGVSAR